MPSYDYLQRKLQDLEEALDELRHTYPLVVDSVLDRAHKKARGYAGGKAYPRDQYKDSEDHDHPMYPKIFNALRDAGVRGDIADDAADAICRLFHTPAGITPVTLEVGEVAEALERAGVGDIEFVVGLLRERLGETPLLALNAVRIRDLPDQELLGLHRRTHQLWGLRATDHVEEISSEEVVNAHALIRRDMRRRGLRHSIRDTLDDASLVFESEDARSALRDRPAKVIIPDFISVAGSSVDDLEGAEDIDVVVRQRARDEGVEIQVRKALDPEKAKDLHFIYNPVGPHGDYIPLYDLVLRPSKELAVHKVSEAVKPGSRYQVMKPSVGDITDEHDVSGLIPWVEARLNKVDLYASPKIDGIHAVISHDGGTDVWFEDSKETKVPKGLPELSGSFVVEGEFTAKKNGKWLSRIELAGALDDPDAVPVFHLYDLLYVDGEDISKEPFSKRLERLSALELPKEHFTVLPQRKIRSASGLKSAAVWAFAHSPLSEGLFVREDAPYEFGTTATAAKLKAGLELKVEVIAVHSRKNGYVYQAGLREPKGYTNVGGDLVDLGNTFVSKEKLADVGDTLRVLVEELGETDGKLYWGKPHPKGTDSSRAFTAYKAVDLAKRRGVWKAKVTEASQGAMVCLPVPDEIANWVGGLMIPGEITDYLHVTLAYLGDKESAPMDRETLLQRVEAFANQAPPIIGAISGVGRFINHLGQSSLYLSVDSPQLPTFRAELVDRLGSASYTHGFTPHITLSYLLGSEPVTLLLEAPIPLVFTEIAVAWGNKRTAFSLKGDPGRVSEAGDDEEGEAGAKYWEEHWFEVLPKSGKGDFSLQAHWRGLTEEEVDLDYSALTKTDHSLHFDARQTAQGGDLWGMTVFAGKAKDNVVPRIFQRTGTLRGTFKLAQPTKWLTIARGKPWVRKPGEIGATIGTFAKFFELDRGTYELGVCRQHSLEIFYFGGKLKGRYLMTYAPVGREELQRLRESQVDEVVVAEAEETGRVWLLRPSPGQPIAQKYGKEELVEEIRKKGQKYLYWNDPESTAGPELIDVSSGS